MINRTVMTLAGAALIAGLATAADAAPKMKAKANVAATPGHQMQAKGSVAGHPGASGYAPGHVKKKRVRVRTGVRVN